MATPKTRTFSSGRAAVKNARSLEAKGQISKAELRGVERSTQTPKPRSIYDMIERESAKRK
jgi:hypothetical protein